MFQIITGDITKIRCDAIVNAANKKLKGGGGVNGAIQKAAGPELLKDSLKLGGCPVGQAKVTGGYKLPCKHIIHAVAPHWGHGLLREKEKLASCYRVSLELAEKHDCKTVAFPLLGAGNCGIPYNIAMGIAVWEISEYLRNREMTVALVLFSSGAADQELSRAGPESMYYGLNAMSDNLIMVDRKLLPNPSGLILGKPGAGRAFQSREEIAEEIKKT